MACRPLYLEQLKEMVKSDNLEPYVKFIDFRANPYPVVNQADIVLVCSRMEAFGRVTLEAMLLKKPVIGTNTGGTVEQVTEGFNGLLYTPGDCHQLAEKIGYLIEHREKIKEFGENGYKFVKENFTKEKSGGKLSELLRTLKGAPNPSSAVLLQWIAQSILNKYFNLLSILDTKESQIAKRDNEIASLQINIASLQSQIADIKYSTSWRLTRPLRFIGSFLSRKR